MKHKTEVRSSGFTLIEILIVVAIIGILSAGVLVGLGPVQRQGRDARRLADLRSVQNALELYFGKCTFYPGSYAAGGGCPASFTPLTGTDATIWQNLTQSITQAGIGVTQVPNDPSAGRSYCYTSNDPGMSYVIGAKLEDANNPALSRSVSGVVCGSLTCGTGGVYCVQL